MEALKDLLGKMDEFKAMVAEQKAAIEKAQADKAASDAAAAAAEELKNTKLGATVTTAYIIASADGAVSATEVSHIRDRMRGLTGGEVGDTAIDAMLRNAEKQLAGGRDAAIQDICAKLTTDAERRAAFMVAANVSWTGGGIGTQEGLALQAISKAFGWEMNAMHKLLGQARG